MASALAAEHFIEQVGFAACLTDSRRPGPSLYVAVCGRRDAVMPRNVQTDHEASLTWLLKDEMVRRGKVYYGKLARGKTMFLAPRMIPYFDAVWGVRRKDEAARLSRPARAILKVLRREWEMGTSDLRDESGVTDRAAFTRGVDELQAALLVVPSEVLYRPKFTYIWSLAVGRFPDGLTRRVGARRGAARDRPQLPDRGGSDGAGRAGARDRAVAARRRSWQSGPRRRGLRDHDGAGHLPSDVHGAVAAARTRRRSSTTPADRPRHRRWAYHPHMAAFVARFRAPVVVRQRVERRARRRPGGRRRGRRLGAVVAHSRRTGRAAAVPPARVPRRAASRTARLMYTSVRREANGMGWATDYPFAGINLLTRVRELTKTHVSMDAEGEPNYWVVRLTDDALFSCPFTMATDVGTRGVLGRRGGAPARLPAQGRVPLGGRLLGHARLGAMVRADAAGAAGVPHRRRAGRPSDPSHDVQRDHREAGDEHQLVAAQRRRDRRSAAATARRPTSG